MINAILAITKKILNILAILKTQATIIKMYIKMNAFTTASIAAMSAVRH